jgi:hypothetical protein
MATGDKNLSVAGFEPRKVQNMDWVGDESRINFGLGEKGPESLAPLTKQGRLKWPF